MRELKVSDVLQAENGEVTTRRQFRDLYAEAPALRHWSQYLNDVRIHKNSTGESLTRREWELREMNNEK